MTKKEEMQNELNQLISQLGVAVLNRLNYLNSEIHKLNQQEAAAAQPPKAGSVE